MQQFRLSSLTKLSGLSFKRFLTESPITTLSFLLFKSPNQDLAIPVCDILENNENNNGTIKYEPGHPDRTQEIGVRGLQGKLSCKSCPIFDVLPSFNPIAWYARQTGTLCPSRLLYFCWLAGCTAEDVKPPKKHTSVTMGFTVLLCECLLPVVMAAQVGVRM